MMHPPTASSSSAPSTAADPASAGSRGGRGIGYQNVALTAIAGALVLQVMGGSGLTGSSPDGALAPSAAMAQADAESQMPNAFVQRKEIIAELRQMNSRLERMESRMTQGMNVKVTDMPAMKLPAELRAALLAASKPSAPVRPAPGPTEVQSAAPVTGPVTAPVVVPESR